MSDRPAAIDAVREAASAAASKITYAGAGTGFVGWLLSNEGVVLIGVVASIGGFVVNLFFKVREDRRQQREHEARMAQIRED